MCLPISVKATKSTKKQLLEETYRYFSAKGQDPQFNSN